MHDHKLRATAIGVAAGLLWGLWVAGSAGAQPPAPTQTSAPAPSMAIDYAFYIIGNQICDRMGHPVAIQELIVLAQDGIVFVNSTPGPVWLSVRDVDPANSALGNQCTMIPKLGRQAIVIPAAAKTGATATISVYDAPCPAAGAANPIKPIIAAPSIKIGDGP